METIIYSVEGKEVGKVTLPVELFGLPWNADLVHQVVHAMQANQRATTAHTKNRGDVEGSRKKPWQQKGTGRARHGDIRSPIWKGGGVTHGPLSEKNYKQKINKKMKQKALFTLLSAKLRDGKILFVENVTSSGKTKEAAETMLNLSKVKGFTPIASKKANVELAVLKRTPTLSRAFRNLPQVTVTTVAQLNPADLANTRYLVITDAKEAITALASKA